MIQLEHIIARPARRLHRAPLLLIHGAWHGAWCWEPAMAGFAAHGFETHAVSLRGHGDSPRPSGYARSTIIQYASDLRAAVAAVGPRPVVVGHSLGGLLIQMLITGILGPVPEVAGAVLLCSSPVSLRAYFTRSPAAEPISLPAMLRLEPQAMRAAIFRPDIPAAELAHHVARMVVEPPMVTPSSMLLRPRPAACRTPMLVIAAERDSVYGPQIQRDTAAAYGCALLVVPAASHDLMLDPAWPIAAAAIERFAAGGAGPPQG
ncbi:MAG: alpha/beta fold hydrolase [Chloroflexales bacterium]